ncbi:hypothetical protein [Streptomyces sp. 7-21]|uniref:hypothetical protein n=1 Tax=Streptomyces sp. 7-21 TaxID=2802283 RepID=UPI00192004E5|nr:hypothetical protein [Streptomyces sp. 7-21]MBL1067444.1 hypothetical protein [Streptomyces sp. 7-21]
MRRTVSLAAVAVTAVLVAGGCSSDSGSSDGDSGGDSSQADAPQPTHPPGEQPEAEPSPTPEQVTLADLAGGWMPAQSDGGAYYTLLIDANGDADSVGSPAPGSPLQSDAICFGSVEEEGVNQLSVELECSSLAGLEGTQESFQGTATVETAPGAAGAVGEVWECDEGPAVLRISWAQGFEDVLCWIGETGGAPEAGG